MILNRDPRTDPLGSNIFHLYGLFPAPQHQINFTVRHRTLFIDGRCEGIQVAELSRGNIVILIFFGSCSDNGLKG